MLLDACTATATTAKEGQDAHKLQEKADSYPICGSRLQGGEGPARSCETLSGYKDFHTEAGYVHRGDGRRKLAS